jgi:hypothetical protein
MAAIIPAGGGRSGRQLLQGHLVCLLGQFPELGQQREQLPPCLVGQTPKDGCVVNDRRYNGCHGHDHHLERRA